MIATLNEMKKQTKQVRLTVELYRDVEIVAAALGKEPNEYVEDVTRAAVKRDLPHAAKIVQERADDRHNGKPMRSKPAAE